MRTETFIIHLARAHGRAPQVARLQERLPGPVTVINAVDGQALSDEEVSAVYRPNLHRPRYPFALRRPEIACFLSHRLVWQTILERGLDAALVVEDDVEVDEARFPAILALALSRMHPSDVVRFPRKAEGETGPVIAAQHGARLVVPRHPRLGTQAMLVGREAAGRLLDFSVSFDRPVDTTLQMHWLHRTRIVTAMPVCIREMTEELGGTTVQGRTKPVVEVLSREFLRARYRLCIALLSVVYFNVFVL